MQCNVSVTVEIPAEAELAELEQVVLGDGAGWIKTQAELHFPEAFTILDWAHSAWGCCRLSEHLRLDGVSMSSPTIQAILIKHGMASRFDRLLKLEE